MKLGKRLASRTPSRLDKSGNGLDSSRTSVEEDPLASAPLPARLATLAEADVPTSRPRKPRSRMGKFARMLGIGRTPPTQMVKVGSAPSTAEVGSSAPEAQATIGLADAAWPASPALLPLNASATGGSELTPLQDVPTVRDDTITRADAVDGNDDGASDACEEDGGEGPEDIDHIVIDLAQLEQIVREEVAIAAQDPPTAPPIRVQSSGLLVSNLVDMLDEPSYTLPGHGQADASPQAPQPLPPASRTLPLDSGGAAGVVPPPVPTDPSPSPRLSLRGSLSSFTSALAAMLPSPLIATAWANREWPADGNASPPSDLGTISANGATSPSSQSQSSSTGHAIGLAFAMPAAALTPTAPAAAATFTPTAAAFDPNGGGFTALPLLPASTALAQEATASTVERGGRNTMGRKEWSAEEDAAILAAVQRHGQKWRVIAAELPDRSDDAVRNRWKRLVTPVVGGAGASLADALGMTDEGSAAGGAAAASARKPADEGGQLTKLAPPKGERLAWSKAEDALIVQSVQQLGLKWGKISQRLEGRTAHAIRNRFHRLQQLQAQQRAAGAAPKASVQWRWEQMTE